MLFLLVDDVSIYSAEAERERAYDLDGCLSYDIGVFNPFKDNFCLFLFVA